MDLKKCLKDLMQKNKIKPVTVSLSDNDILKGRRALITGGGSGLGFAIAKRFVQSGADVVITGRNEDKLISAQKELNSIRNDSCDFSILDMKKPELFQASFEQIISEKPVDILVNNAGIRSTAKFNNISENEFDDVISTNLKGPVFLSQIVSKYMIGNKIQGNIVNIASSSAIRPANTAYTMSKWALRGFTIGMARELIKYGIVVNGVAPGPCATGMLGIDEDDPVLNWKSNPSQRLVTPEEVAEIVKMLVSDSGRMIVGDIVYATGGGGITTIDDVK